MTTRTVDTTPYRLSHITEPRGYGDWVFENADTGEWFEGNGLYSKVRKSLPPGTWKLLP